MFCCHLSKSNLLVVIIALITMNSLDMDMHFSEKEILWIKLAQISKQIQLAQHKCCEFAIKVMPATRNYGQHTPKWYSLLNILFQPLDTTRNWMNSRELEWKNATQAIKLQEVLTNAQIGIHCTLDLNQIRWRSNSRSFFILTETFTCNGIQTQTLQTWSLGGGGELTAAGGFVSVGLSAPQFLLLHFARNG